VGDVIASDGETRAEPWRVLHHAYGFSEKSLLRLVLLCGAAVDLGRSFLIANNTVKADRSSPGRLAVALSNFAIEGAETAEAIRAHPSKEACIAELLIRREIKRADAFSIGKIKNARPKVDDAKSSSFIKTQAAFMAMDKIVKMADDGKADELASDNAAVDDAKDVGIDFFKLGLSLL
jgi:hypothetical protein